MASYFKIVLSVFGKGKELLKISFLVSAALLSFSSAAQAQQTGTLEGQIIDSTNTEPIFGANVFISEISRGNATDLNGNYNINRIPAGTYQVRFSYVSYKTKFVTVEIEAGQTMTLNVGLAPDYVVGEEIQVLAQAAGQVAAIKDQLKSNTIVNVVSAERISELPDQNAAESVGRLPGVSVQRNAGEASKVVVRGLSPRFNSITVNGVRIPGTDPSNRSVDLSLVPSDVVGGIEVYKALTPDKDGDAIGGTVNLLVRAASDGFKGSARLQTGYNDLQNEYRQYKGSINLSDRFLDDKLGVLVTGSIQKANRSSDLVDADYSYIQSDEGLEIENFNLADITETRQRYGASLALDYDLNSTQLFLSSFMGRTDRDEVRRRKRYRVGNGRVEYDVRDRDINEQVYSNSLRGEHDLNWVNIDWQVAHSYALTNQPNTIYSRFEELAAYETGLVVDEGPDPIPGKAKNDLSRTYFKYGTFNDQRGTDRNITAELNFKIPYSLGDKIGGYLKFGGKYRDKKREQSVDELQTDFGVVDKIGQENSDQFTLYNDQSIAISNFIDPSKDVDDFADGKYEFGPYLKNGQLNQFYQTYQNRYIPNRFIELSNYTAGEKISAAYVMTEINLGSKLMILPGARYEYTENYYEGVFGNIFGNLGKYGSLVDTTGGKDYGELLPMAHLKYSIVEGIDLRLAVTKTLSRPDYYNLVPSEIINEAEQTISRGDPNLKHTKALNYDAFLSFYKSNIGYFSVGGFYKKLDDIDYIYQGVVRDEGEFDGFILTSPVNGEESTVYGMEFDIQTDFRYLPKPLDGLILSTNFTFIHSETFFPFLKKKGFSPEPPFETIYIDTVRSGKLPGQPDFVASLTIGYEKGGFSGRVSYSYQEEILERVGIRPQEDIIADSYGYWDLSINQKFKQLEAFTFFLNVNNFTRQSEKSLTRFGNFTGENEIFGLTGDVGIRYGF